MQMLDISPKIRAQFGSLLFNLAEAEALIEQREERISQLELELEALRASLKRATQDDATAS